MSSEMRRDIVEWNSAGLAKVMPWCIISNNTYLIGSWITKWAAQYENAWGLQNRIKYLLGAIDSINYHPTLA